MRPLAALRRYMAADDPRAGTANLIAMVLAWNTPFYPFYVLGTAGSAMQPGAWYTLASFPVFLAVPVATRRWPLAGRALLALAGLANTVWCTWLLGEGSGTQLFLLPCIMLAPLLFRYAERVALLVFIALPIVVGLLLDGRYPESPFACEGTSCGNLLWLNAFSVAMLFGFFGLLIAKSLAPGDGQPISGGRVDPSMHRRRPPVR